MNFTEHAHTLLLLAWVLLFKNLDELHRTCSHIRIPPMSIVIRHFNKVHIACSHTGNFMMASRMMLVEDRFWSHTHISFENMYLQTLGQIKAGMPTYSERKHVLTYRASFQLTCLVPWNLVNWRSPFSVPQICEWLEEAFSTCGSSKLKCLCIHSKR